MYSANTYDQRNKTLELNGNEVCVLRLQHGSVEQILLKVLRGNLWAGAVTGCIREVLALSSGFRQRPQNLVPP